MRRETVPRGAERTNEIIDKVCEPDPDFVEICSLAEKLVAPPAKETLAGCLE